jgi:hypothetical protein
MMIRLLEIRDNGAKHLINVKVNLNERKNLFTEDLFVKDFKSLNLCLL